MREHTDSLYQARKHLHTIERVLDYLEGQPEGTPFHAGNVDMIRRDLGHIALYGSVLQGKSEH
jgi:hypothetical protein